MRSSDVIERLVIVVVLLAVFIFIDDRFGPKQNPHYLECSRIGRANVQAVEPVTHNTEDNYVIAGVFTNVWDCVLCPPEQMGQIMWDTKNDRPFTGAMMDRGEPLEFKDGFPVNPIQHIQEVIANRMVAIPFFGTITNGTTVVKIYDGRVIEIGELK